MSNYDDDKKAWLKIGREKGAKYVVNWLDSFEYEHYPQFCMTDQELKQAKEKNFKNMSQIYEIWEL